MDSSDQKREDEVLKRMLATKPKPHKEKVKHSNWKEGVTRPNNEKVTPVT
jgi:hypothetical protein